MKKFPALALLSLILGGCATSPTTPRHAPTPTPDLAGLWVGKASAQTHTLLVRPDGTGTVCWESMGKYSAMPLTISGDKMIGLTDATLKRNADGSFAQCSWGVCMEMKRTMDVPAACRAWLKR
ncbi:hypothetical protein F2P44_25015 [Massilia sp. CCM 8695]|uniref:Lipoprotein n=1 Tax=Massilia frigida TaxID=2609281 RepID=A0ABX0NAQ4_9BURK|nr:J517_1871 family lipoprotein [Massilia frigida]NHZ82515.1 hypothetical protein [Massilia frigida]